MTQSFKINGKGNIAGVCPDDLKTKHYTECKACDKLLSMPGLLGVPKGKMVCKGGGIEGFWKESRK